MDPEVLRKFYFSGASSFGPFSESRRNRKLHNNTAASAPNAASSIDTTDPEATSMTAIARPSTVDPQQSASGSASHITAIRKIASQQAQRSRAVDKPRLAPPPDAATTEYMNFLRQGQELQRMHQSIVEALSTLISCRRDEQRRVTDIRAVCRDELETIEADHDWKLRSKYNVQQLSKDCGLGLTLPELVAETEPSTVALDSMLQNFSSLKAQYGRSLQFAPYALVVDQALRRLSVLEGAMKEGNSDATPLCRLLDTLFVEVEELCKVPTMEQSMTPFESLQQETLCTVDGYRQQRLAAIEDGEVNVAERLCYDVVDEYEKALANLLSKIGALEEGLLRTEGRREVCLKYQAVPRREFKLIKDRCSALIEACRKDIHSMYVMRQKIEEIEARTQAKVESDRRQSDERLQKNNERQIEIFAEMERLERELEQVERERHAEIQRRLAEKDKDEHRRAEHAQFCATVDSHTIPLERTIRNMELMNHASEVLSELAESGFNTVREDLDSQEELYRRLLLTARKEHLELVRQLTLELGDIVRRKENRVGETDEKIRQAHIQQELLAETYNPNAKKFGDIKKQLLHARDELEHDVVLLKQRLEKALSDFAPTEKALHQADISFVHPVTEQEQHSLLQHAKVMELKSISIGAPQGTHLNTQARGLQRTAEELCKEASSVNDTTASVTSTTIPLIRAATRKHLGKVQDNTAS